MLLISPCPTILPGLDVMQRSHQSIVGAVGMFPSSLGLLPPIWDGTQAIWWMDVHEKYIRDSPMPLKSLIFEGSLCPLRSTQISPIGCPIIWHSCPRASYLLCTYYGAFWLHTIGHFIYLWSGILFRLGRTFLWWKNGPFLHQPMGPNIYIPSGILCTYDGAYSFL